MNTNRHPSQIAGLIVCLIALFLASCRPIPNTGHDQATPKPTPLGETLSTPLPGCVISDSAPVRSGPNADNYPVGTLAHGASILALGRSNDQLWYQIDLSATGGKGQSGWIANEFVLVGPDSMTICLAAAQTATLPSRTQEAQAFTPTGSPTAVAAAPSTPTPSPMVQFTASPSPTWTKTPRPYVVPTAKVVHEPNPAPSNTPQPTAMPFVPEKPTDTVTQSPAPSDTPKPTDVVLPPAPTETPIIIASATAEATVIIIKTIPPIIKFPTPTNTPNVTQGPPPGTPVPGR